MVRFHLPPEAWAISFTPLCLCLSEETLKVDGPFYLVFMPGEVKDPTQGGNGKNLVVDSPLLYLGCLELNVISHRSSL